VTIINFIIDKWPHSVVFRDVDFFPS